MHSIGFTGTRLGMTRAQKEIVAALLAGAPRPDFVVHGSCVGADDEFDVMAHALGLRRVIRPCTIAKLRAPCDRRGAPSVCAPLPPLARNGLIVADATWLIATPREPVEVGRSGTWATVRLAVRAKRPILIVDPDGDLVWR